MGERCTPENRNAIAQKLHCPMGDSEESTSRGIFKPFSLQQNESFPKTHLSTVQTTVFCYFFRLKMFSSQLLIPSPWARSPF